MHKFKYYRLLWLLPLPFALFALWVAVAWVFNLAHVSEDMQYRAIGALIWAAPLATSSIFSRIVRTNGAAAIYAACSRSVLLAEA